MKKTVSYHRSQLLALLDVPHHTLRAWLSLEPLASRETKSRLATDYSILDALFLMVMKRLDSAGFPPKALKSFSSAVYKSLQRTLEKDSADMMHLFQDADGDWQVGEAPDDSDAIRMAIPLQRARFEVYEYTGVNMIVPQGEMPFFTAISSNKPKSTSKKKGAA